MNQVSSESCKTGNPPTRRLLGIEDSDFLTDGRIDGRRPVLESFPHRVVNRRREKIWHERCEPGQMPCLSLPSAVIGFLVGIGFAIYLGAFVRNVATDATGADKETPPSYPVEAWMKEEDAYEHGDIGFMMSEAGMDHHAQEQAEKIRHETERRLAQIDEIMVWRLDDWRQPLATLQDMMVQLAGVGTGGGTWVGHEMQRNDLKLEADLLEPHAEALAGNSFPEPSTELANPETAQQRTKDWQLLWTEFETTAETLRESPGTDRIWKEHLVSTLNEARKAHGSLAMMLGNLENEVAAQAVIQFYGDYLIKNFSQFMDDDPTEEQSW